MQKILAALGLPDSATEDDAVGAITAAQTNAEKTAKDLEDALGKRPDAAMEKRIAAKVTAGLSREVAIDAIKNQDREDAAVKKEKGK